MVLSRLSYVFGGSALAAVVRTSARAPGNDAMTTMTQLAVVVAVTIVVMLVITYTRR